MRRDLNIKGCQGFAQDRGVLFEAAGDAGVANMLEPVGFSKQHGLNLVPPRPQIDQGHKLWRERGLLNAMAPHYPWLIGGAADLAPSTKTRLTFEGAGDFEAGNYGGRNLHFGIREHAMGAIVNGLSLSKIRAFGAGFLIFSDYMNPIRLSALMDLPTIWIFTHGSIGLGQDGPTHQPVEQLIALRAIPGLITLRPADTNEVVEAWRVIMQLKHRAACLVLSGQPLPTFDRTRYASARGLERGAYVMADPQDGKPDVILIGTGSEVALCVDVYEALEREGIPAPVVSMPSTRVSVEEGSVIGWDRYAGSSGAKIGMHTFGSSAPIGDLLKKFGFTQTR